ncbi:MAG: sodium:proton antiporter [Chlorobi bacterium]|nr:sodium:proton antiporter [Chlorobiota bacterium]
MSANELLLGLTGILVLGIVAQWLAWRFVLPSILVLLVFGFLAGPVFGIIEPNAILGDLLFPVVSVSVAIILFEGGLTLRFSELSEIGKVVRNLVTIGALITWIGTSIAAHLIFELHVGIAILLGAILVVSGPTVVMPLLRHVRPSRRVGSILKWEGIVIDPIGALLAVLVFKAIISGNIIEGTFATLEGLVLTILVGTGIGIGAALLFILILMRYWIPDFLHNPFSLMMVVGAFAISNTLQYESGLFAATVMGIALTNQKMVDVKHILEFKENLRVLLISSIFIILAARLELDSVTGYITTEMLLFLGVLLLIIRPLSTVVSSFGSPLKWKERAFIAWMAPRGIVAAAVSAIFGLYLSERGILDAEQLAPLTFLVIVGTVTIYGLTAGPFAKLLGVAMPQTQGLLVVGAHSWGRAIGKALQEAGFRVLLVDTNMANISAAKNIGLFANHGSVLSEYILDKIELEGIGRMLALTSNDEVNALAALYFTERFGRSEVYQLPPSGKSRVQRDSVPQSLRGRILFTPEATYEFFEEAFEAGATIQSIFFNDDFTYDDFMAAFANEVVPLFVVAPDLSLQAFTETSMPEPLAGQRLIYMQEPRL